MNLAIQNIRQLLQTGRKKMSRRILHWQMRGRPEAEILAAERKLRGVEQFDKLERADIVVVSFGKSGRTWLRVMISHVFRVMHGLPEDAVLSFDNFHNINNAVPKIFFTHDNYSNANKNKSKQGSDACHFSNNSCRNKCSENTYYHHE